MDRILGSRPIPDAKVHGQVVNWLEGIEAECVNGPPNFSHYIGILQAQRKAGEEPSSALVRRMYMVDARQALFAMMDAYQIKEPQIIKPLRWADHVVGEVLWRKQWQFELGNDTLNQATTELTK